MKCPKCRFDNPSETRFCGNCGVSLHPEKDFAFTETMQTHIRELTAGTTFARRYQIIEDLGKGGMGRVYKVFDTEVREKMALKLLNPDIASDEQTIERFRNELKLARAYWKKGDLDKAAAEYEKLMTIDPKNQVRYLIHPLYHYRLGRVFGEKGFQDRAAEQYTKFLQYWKDADEKIPEKADARQRLAKLK
jgi:tetratricopeptide (TPR) repeat protein